MPRLTLIFAFTSLLSSLGLAALNVPLTVKDGANTGSVSQYPVKVGVPLPSGGYDDISRFRVTDASGNTVPAQFDVLCRYWPRNNSIRVVLVQFLVSFAKNGATRYYLKDDGTGNASTGLTVADGADRWTINVGVLKAEVRKTGFNILDRLAYDVNGNGAFEASEELISPDPQNGAELTDTLGVKTLGSGKTGLQLTLEESGPLRAAIRVESPTGATPTGWGFVCRLYFYYNTPFITMDYFLKNSQYGTTGHNLYFSKFSLVNKLQNLGTCTVKLGGAFGDNSGSYQGALSGAASVRATAWKAYTVNGAAGTGLCAGYADISDAEKGVMAVVRKFSQLHPCQIEVGTDKSLNVNLQPQGRHLLVDETRISHQVMLYFHPAAKTQAELFLQAKLFQQYPVAVVPPRWYTLSHAVSDFGGFYTLDTAGNAGNYIAPVDISPSDQSHQTGWRNWGGDVGRRDSYVVGGWPSYLAHFVMSGHPAHLYEADDVVRHETSLRPMWIDDYQYPRDKGLKVITYPADVGTRAPYGPPNDPDFWSSWDYQHSWVFRVFEYYCFTGERFCAEYLPQHADVFLNQDQRFLTMSGAPGSQSVDLHRGVTEPLRIVLDAYKATGDARFWDYLIAFAKNIVDLYSTDAVQGSKYGAFKRAAIQHGTVSLFVGDFYFMLPETTPEERAFKERYRLMMEGGSNGQVYWGGSHFGSCDSSWGLNYDWSAEPYVRPNSPNYQTSYGYNLQGLNYFLTGRVAYRECEGLLEHGYLTGNCASDSTNVINIARVYQQRPDMIPLSGWYRLGTASCYWPELKAAPVPARIADVDANASHDGRVLLQWTSVGGDAYRIHWAAKPIKEPTAQLSLKCRAFPYPDTSSSVAQIYKCQAFDVGVKPKATGQAETFEIGPLPDSLDGRKLWFNVEAVNIVSEYDMSMSPLSNVDSVVFNKNALSGGPGIAVSADTNTGTAPFSVHFTCQVTSGAAASFLWNFGDGTTSVEQNSGHVYATAGDFSVSCIARDGAGNSTSKLLQIKVHSPSGVEETTKALPTTPFIKAFPNPCNRELTIRLYAGKDQRGTSAELAIFNVRGTMVKSYPVGASGRGIVTLHWNGRDAGSKTLPSGVYVLKFGTSKGVLLEKVLLAK